MDAANPQLWLAWALFGTYLAWLVWRRYLPAAREGLLPVEFREARPAWLICEEGTALDRRVRWFPLGPRRTVVGSLPRADTETTRYVYLAAEDIRQDHAVIDFDPLGGRYRVEAVEHGLVLHNNEPLSPGGPAALADGDTLDLGRISRFRFTFEGPEAGA